MTVPTNTNPPSTKPASDAVPASEERSLNFLEQIVEADNASKKWGTWGARDPSRADVPQVHTRFPPEPNGYLHVGHAKSICLNSGLAKKYGGKFNLRFDDTNPAKEEQEYVDSIIRDVKWLGGDFDTGPNAGGLYFASNYFEQMYAFTEELVKKGKAYVCQLSGEEVSARRGTPTVPATSPFRDRPIEESLKLLAEMRDGKHPNGAMTVRAKIDLASPNFNLRDPVMYRIIHEHHHNTGDKWSMYPMYDWAHGLEDSLEGITHSICTLEFENHRPLYDWFIDSINEGRGGTGLPPGVPSSSWSSLPKIHHPQQIEFAKLRPTYTVMSKRNLLKMVEEKTVSGWDDPRMPTISAMRRRGYPPEALRNFVTDVGVTKVESYIDVGRLENAVRDVLNKTTPRTMAVLKPLKVTIENWPEDKIDELDFVINPEDAAAGKRKVPFSRVIYIEQDDFIENPPKKFFRLAPGTEVRLRWAYFITCTGVEKDAAGNVTGIRATYDPATRGGDAPVGPDGKPTKKVKGTIHWISAKHAVPAEVRLFDRLFTAEIPGDRTGNYLDDLNPSSLEVVQAFVEPWLAENARYNNETLEGERFQFERLGYFNVDKDSKPGKLVFNRTVTLKDSWMKEAKPGA
ncbi:MAG: glutamine--tRNA ligase/YqeY domain fusion protein [Phycisphaerales bacterium]|nr:glutamine--tRNA ligase/YqeY domain fusion protein [Phycisphaerales bacterium]